MGKIEQLKLRGGGPGRGVGVLKKGYRDIEKAPHQLGK